MLLGVVLSVLIIVLGVVLRVRGRRVGGNPPVVTGGFVELKRRVRTWAGGLSSRDLDRYGVADTASAVGLHDRDAVDVGRA